MTSTKTSLEAKPLVLYVMDVDARSWTADPGITVASLDLEPPAAQAAPAAVAGPGICLVSGVALSELARTDRLEGLSGLGAIVAVADGEREVRAARRAGAVAVLPARFLETDGALARALLRELVGSDGSARSELERLARDAVHELRTPLTVIVEFASLLEDGVGGALETRARDYVGQVLSAAQRLAEQLDDYRGSVRARLGTLRLRPDWCDLGELLGKVRDRCDTEVHAATPECVWLDREAVGTALQRLLGGAVRCSSRKRLPTLRVFGDSQELAFEVAYEGREPTPEDCDLLERGSRDDDAHLRSLASVFGLGITFADDVARTAGGHLILEPLEGEGGRFVLRLPVQVGAADGSTPKDAR